MHLLAEQGRAAHTPSSKQRPRQGITCTSAAARRSSQASRQACVAALAVALRCLTSVPATAAQTCSSLASRHLPMRCSAAAPCCLCCVPACTHVDQSALTSRHPPHSVQGMSRLAFAGHHLHVVGRQESSGTRGQQACLAHSQPGGEDVTGTAPGVLPSQRACPAGRLRLALLVPDVATEPAQRRYIRPWVAETGRARRCLAQHSVHDSGPQRTATMPAQAAAARVNPPLDGLAGQPPRVAGGGSFPGGHLGPASSAEGAPSLPGLRRSSASSLLPEAEPPGAEALAASCSSTPGGEHAALAGSQGTSLRSTQLRQALPWLPSDSPCCGRVALHCPGLVRQHAAQRPAVLPWSSMDKCSAGCVPAAVQHPAASQAGRQLRTLRVRLHVLRATWAVHACQQARYSRRMAKAMARLSCRCLCCRRAVVCAQAWSARRPTRCRSSSRASKPCEEASTSRGALSAACRCHACALLLLLSQRAWPASGLLVLWPAGVACDFGRCQRDAAHPAGPQGAVHVHERRRVQKRLQNRGQQGRLHRQVWAADRAGCAPGTRGGPPCARGAAPPGFVHPGRCACAGASASAGGSGRALPAARPPLCVTHVTLSLHGRPAVWTWRL